MTTARQQQLPGSYQAVSKAVNGFDAPLDRATDFSWVDWFHHASPQQRSHALTLAQQQGLLYPHQLSVHTTNGAKPVGTVKETELSSLLTSLLTGKSATLSRLSSGEIAFFDGALDDLQKQAVSRALHSPDFSLLQGLPGTGKSRVIAEVILQYAAQGRRVLLLSGIPSSLDVVLERLVGRSEVFALRLLDSNEQLETLPSWLRGFTLEEQKQAFLERVLTGARQNRELFEATCRQRTEQLSLWDELHACAEKAQILHQESNDLRTKSAAIADLVDRDLATPQNPCELTQRIADLQTTLDRELLDLTNSIQQKQEQLQKLTLDNAARAAHIAELDPAYQAKKQGRFFSVHYWTNLFNSNVLTEMERLLEEQTKATTFLDQLQCEIGQLKQRSQDRQAQFDQDRSAAIRNEIETRTHANEREQAAVDTEQRANDDRWHSLCSRLNQSELAKSADAITAAQQTWLAHKKYDEQQCQFARHWTDFVETTGPQLAMRLPGLANVLTATTQRWHADAKLRDNVNAPFDLVIVEDADSHTDADLQKLTRTANRCMLVCHQISESLPVPSNSSAVVRVSSNGPLTGATSWRRLWQAVGGDAWHGPYSWRRDQGRLICQLIPLTSADHAHLDSERLVDAPDIELRILHTPRATPRLAQVIFNEATSFEDAFAFVLREIQEFPLEPAAATGWWDEQATSVRLNFGHQPSSIESWVHVETGVRVGVQCSALSSVAPRIACVDFDPSTGFDRCAAEGWMRERRPVQDNGRAVYLQTPYRYNAELAGFIQSVVQPNDWQSPNALPPSHASSLTFIAVPALASRDWPREGAGLELDLSASRHADRLPVGLRQGLPVHGFVNYLEAQVLVRRLETWLEKECPAKNSRVVVLALYASQVDLLRRLAEQSEILRASTVPFEITLPSRMKQRECDTAFLSLTRSHGHRATAFGESADELPIALTRASKRLFIFGDPGTLNRRTHWNGPLDQLDSNSAQQELLRLQRLVTCLQHATQSVHANGKSDRPH